MMGLCCFFHVRKWVPFLERVASFAENTTVVAAERVKGCFVNRLDCSAWKVLETKSEGF